MRNFLVLYMSPFSAEEQMQNASPEDMQKGMEPWVKWFGVHNQAIVDQGKPTGNEMNVTKTGSTKPKTFIGGYSFLQAEDADAVKSMLSDHPHFMLEGSSIEVLELMTMQGM